MNISHNRQFCGFIFKFVWAVYGGDLTGFCQSFRKVILKNDERQTKSKKSQKVPGYEPLWYAHSTALPQSYPASIGSGRCPLKFKSLIGVGKLSSAGDRQIPKCTDPFIPGQYQDYIQKYRYFLYWPPIRSETRFGSVWLMVWLSWFRLLQYVTSFTKFQILAEI